jgi:hypothetical protein
MLILIRIETIAPCTLNRNILRIWNSHCIKLVFEFSEDTRRKNGIEQQRIIQDMFYNYTNGNEYYEIANM